jgi:hypothetical protein
MTKTGVVHCIEGTSTPLPTRGNDFRVELTKSLESVRRLEECAE